LARGQKVFRGACDSVTESCQLRPDMDNFEQAKSYFMQGLSALEAKQFEEAESFFLKSLMFIPQRVSTLTNLSAVQLKLKKYTESIKNAIESISIEPENYEAWLNITYAEIALNRLENATKSLKKLLAIDALNFKSLMAQGDYFLSKNEHQIALDFFRKAIKINPNATEAKIKIALMLEHIQDYSGSISILNDLIKQNPQQLQFIGQRFHLKMLICDWSNYNQELDLIEKKISNNEYIIDPFSYQGVATSEMLLQKCAKIYANIFHKSQSPQFKINKFSSLNQQKIDKIRIGYVCGEFRHHATSLLLVEVLEYHDKSNFEIYIYDNGRNDESSVRNRINKAVDKVRIISNLSDDEAYEVITNDGISILVNLNGYYGKERQNLFSKKPAPIQVNYLGYPGTLGTDYFDYIISDSVCTPQGTDSFYNEKIIRLQGCYQPNDSKKEISRIIDKRSNHNLPDNAFVYCCFNNIYKITPQIFHAWCEILTKNKNSVLWLLTSNKSAIENLMLQFINNGIDSSRIIFAPKLPLGEHLSRHKHADLFLDTLPYNAHTTCSDALFAGLPVLTCTGNTFAGRVSSSLLATSGLEGLITKNLYEYKKLAVELCINNGLYFKFKSKLTDVTKNPLFNSITYTKNLELAYKSMFNNFINNQRITLKM
jgi:predicted O-linked N-acetylglucosamine transferase (SPINDLY family)